MEKWECFSSVTKGKTANSSFRGSRVTGCWEVGVILPLLSVWSRPSWFCLLLRTESFHIRRVCRESGTGPQLPQPWVTLRPVQLPGEALQPGPLPSRWARFREGPTAHLQLIQACMFESCWAPSSSIVPVSLPSSSVFKMDESWLYFKELKWVIESKNRIQMTLL